MTIRIVALLLCSLVVPSTAQEPLTIPLWKNGPPGFEDKKNQSEQAESYWVKNVHNPSLTAFLPPKDKATGAAVIIAPGGGHRLLVYNAEGTDAAKYLSSIGVAAFALKYRLGREEGSPYSIEKHAKEDGQRAMRLVRSRAKEWEIDSTRIGMLGFSAGGEVVSMVAYARGEGDPKSDDPVERVSSRPDFQMMVYPGPIGIPEKIPDHAPPAFLVVANDDLGASKVIASLFQKYRNVGLPVEAHVYARGGHAFNMGYRTKLKTLKGWSARMHEWMGDNFILDTTGRDEWLKKEAARREQLRKRHSR